MENLQSSSDVMKNTTPTPTGPLCECQGEKSLKSAARK